MKSINFPNMFNKTNTKLVSDYDATLQNLKLLIQSDKNSLFGDPQFGSGLRRYLFEQNDSILKDILIDDLFVSISTFMPQLSLTRNDIEISSDGTQVYITIKAINQLNFQTDLYNIVLFNTTA